MKLSQKAIKSIKGSIRLRTRLALDLKKTVHTIERWTRKNDDNLTKAAAMHVIREETGMNDSQILEKVKKNAVIV